MATYKVIQDIEAEDKLLGPFTLRQFIYAIITVVSAFIIFKVSLTGAKYFALLLVPHTILFAVLAAPFGHDQPSEVWLLAKIRFFLKPRQRIWDQSGLKELVTITVPKKIEHAFTNGLSQTEVKSRLEALANTIDSRGWAIKNVNVNLFSQPSYVLAQNNSDRLIDPSTIPQEVQNYDIRAAEDVLDEQTSPTAQHFTQLIGKSEQAHRQQIMHQMQQGGTAPATPPDYWFLTQGQATPPPAGYAASSNNPVVAPGSDPIVTTNSTSDADEQALLAKIHEDQKHPTEAGHLKKILPLAEQQALEKKRAAKARAVQKTQPFTPTAPTPTIKEPTVSPPVANPAVLGLANNSDLNVATIARQAAKATKLPPPDEVVVKLR